MSNFPIIDEAEVLAFNGRTNATKQILFSWTTNATPAVAYNLSNTTVTMVVKESETSSEAVLSLSSAGVSPAISVNGTTWEVTITISKALMSTLRNHKYWYEIALNDSVRSVAVVPLEGPFVVKTGVA